MMVMVMMRMKLKTKRGCSLIMSDNLSVLLGHVDNGNDDGNNNDIDNDDNFGKDDGDFDSHDVDNDDNDEADLGLADGLLDGGRELGHVRILHILVELVIFHFDSINILSLFCL